MGDFILKITTLYVYNPTMHQPLLNDVLPLVASFLEQRLIRLAKLGSVNYMVPSWSRGQDVHNFRLTCKDWSAVSPKYVSDHPADKESYLNVKAMEVIANALHQQDKVLCSIQDYERQYPRQQPCFYKTPLEALRDEPVIYTYCERDEDDIVDNEDLCNEALSDLFEQTDMLSNLYYDCSAELSMYDLRKFQLFDWTHDAQLILEAKKKYPNNALFALETATFNKRSMANTLLR